MSSSEEMIVDSQYKSNNLTAHNITNSLRLDSNSKPMDSFSMIANTLHFHNPLNSFPGFDTSVNFMQSSFSSDNQSSPSTPLGLNTMLNTQHHNSPNSPNLNSLNTQSSLASSCRDNAYQLPNMNRNQFLAGIVMRVTMKTLSTGKIYYDLAKVCLFFDDFVSIMKKLLNFFNYLYL